VFSYRCPACGKQHHEDAPYEQAFDAPCLRCREMVHVTEELVSVASGRRVATLGGATRPARPGEGIQSTEDRVTRAGGEREEELSARQDVADRGALEKGNEADFADQEGAGDEESKGKAGKQNADALSPTERGRRRWLLITAAGVLVLAMLGTGGYFGYEAYRKNKTSQTADATKASKEKTTSKTNTTQTKVASASKEKGSASTKTETGAKASPAPKDKAAAPKDKPGAAKADAGKKGEPAKLEPAEPVVTARDDKLIRISAPRLSAELAADRAATNAKYKGALLEVSGIYQKTENKETVRPPLRPHLVFATDGPAILGDQLGSHTEPQRWLTLLSGRPCTIRGAYGADGVLHGCDLVPLMTAADELYKGKDLEVSGFVAEVGAGDVLNPFPRLVLEGETQSISTVECLFRTSDRERINDVPVEMPVVIRGTCRGRSFDGLTRRYVVRFDNCEPIFTSAPPADRPRVDAAHLLRAYDEDLRTTLYPKPGEERQLEGTISLAQLESELAANPKEFERKYRDQMLTVKGTSSSKGGLGGRLVLVSGDTNAVLRVECRFVPRVVKELDKGPTFVVRGYCTGLTDSKTLVLENCEPLDPSGRRDLRRLTAEFLPHTPGHSLTYDVAQPTSPDGKPRVVRMIFEQKEGGVVETVTTHVGRLKGASLFDPEEKNGAWIKSGAVRKVRLPGPSLKHRLGGGYVYVGTYESQRPNESQLVWRPALKIGARTGETWNWSENNTLHEYALTKFDTYQGQPSAVVRETIRVGKDPHHPGQIEHVYVKGVGEVERREVQRLTANEQRVVTELRLVDEPRPAADPKTAKPREPGAQTSKAD
jgi:hypothetical protein